MPRAENVENLEALVAYAEGGECRHSEILAYYKDKQRITTCGHCDRCAPESDRRVPRTTNHFSQAQVFSTTSARSSSAKARKRRASADASTDALSPAKKALFQRLKEWRLKTAKELDQPAFVILSDKALRDLIAKNPKSISDLSNVYGFGPAKIERFGTDVLNELCER